MGILPLMTKETSANFVGFTAYDEIIFDFRSIEI